jgi:hypothetical protein
MNPTSVTVLIVVYVPEILSGSRIGLSKLRFSKDEIVRMVSQSTPTTPQTRDEEDEISLKLISKKKKSSLWQYDMDWNSGARCNNENGMIDCWINITHINIEIWELLKASFSGKIQ